MHKPHFDADRVAEAAMKVFWKKGYEATSIQDLMNATGLSRSSLYNSFESKHGIFQHALHRYRHQTAELVEMLAEEGSARDRVRAMLKRIASDEIRDETGSGCMVANTALELGGRDDIVTLLLAEHFSILERALLSLMERGQKQGDIDPDKSPVALARFVLAIIQGLRVVARGGGRSQRVRRLQDVVDVAITAL